jgi:predicted AAA+ superfamily ATPase
VLKRLIDLPKNQNILLFGARGVGKSTWLKHCFDDTQSVCINLLNASDETCFFQNPDELAKIARGMYEAGQLP